jgi:predicted transcriptional regulator
MDSMTKRTKGRVAMYTEVPPQLKAAMEKLAEEHNRSLAGEVITALQQYVQREQQRAKEEGKK